MPRYFFELRYGKGPGDVATDSEGEVLVDDLEARELARRSQHVGDGPFSSLCQVAWLLPGSP